MQRPSILPLASVLLATGLVLSACGSGSDSNSDSTPAEEPAFSTAQDSNSPAGENAEETSPEKETKQRRTETVTKEAAPEQPTPPAGGKHNIHVGQIGGYCGTSSSGDSIDAGDATSCEFAAAVFDAAMQASYTLRSPDPTVTAVYHADVSASSPVTKQSYDLDCRMGSDQRVLTCERPGDKTVRASFETADKSIWSRRVATTN
ncbi:hypothetical protein QP943_02660 [Corynebacterium kefirresidentii]|uniref:hypothetical protein n=1 Tax=Corynebacterium TaxID=1716 RepID=UPI0003B7EF91|nr:MULTISPECIES: hypothetical protein [Corynebacterium]WKS53813.1 hypothetical protein NLL48_01245 [Corynebacterium tuberculostearicum]ERS46101.1 hypothetical protein HMPREF1282_02029 [Corynebacterium sp. KPL1856]ERS48579.1 hypothetical protein HMPREF1286_01398 [Corynebacterium sp. KPL1860]ERS56831.1 hypothetical protein HMPREF1264_00534 [Corynebacterium sp. KPL1821]ERS63142.1 hypothetical protein HMPREF1260_00319 [Corynebacterium sp. KPL1817]